MSQCIKNLLEKDFDFRFKACTYNNMLVALKAFEQFKKENESYFTYDKRETLFGHLRTYSIEKQFNDSAFNPKANYSVSVKQVNKFKYKALIIETEDFIVNLGSTNKPTMLLPKSSYKIEFAKCNADINTQYSLNFLEDGNIQIVNSKKYAVITYGYKLGVLTHLNIIIPNEKYNAIEYSINMLENIKIYNNYVPDELVEESIVTLKDSLLKKAENIG